MTYHIESRWGGGVENPTVDQMRAALSELDAADDEHPDTWLTHESGWTLTAFQSGLLVWESPASDAPPMHMKHVPRDRVLDLWQKLSTGDVESIANEPWLPGYN